MMTLAEWRTAQEKAGRKLTLSKIAAAAGVRSPESVRRHLDGTRRPRAETMRAYRKLTRGQVDIIDWFPERKARRAAAEAAP